VNEPIHVIVAIDEDSNEALYVGGDLESRDGPTVYACDIAAAVGDKVIQFSHVSVSGKTGGVWPKRFEELIADGMK
jgi:hypothetical protein